MFFCLFFYEEIHTRAKLTFFLLFYETFPKVFNVSVFQFVNNISARKTRHLPNPPKCLTMSSRWEIFISFSHCKIVPPRPILRSSRANDDNYGFCYDTVKMALRQCLTWWPWSSLKLSSTGWAGDRGHWLHKLDFFTKFSNWQNSYHSPFNGYFLTTIGKKTDNQTSMFTSGTILPTASQAYLVDSSWPWLDFSAR